MEKFELQKPMPQLFYTLKKLLFGCEVTCISDTVGCSKQLKQSHNYSKIIFCDVITSELYCMLAMRNKRQGRSLTFQSLQYGAMTQDFLKYSQVNPLQPFA